MGFRSRTHDGRTSGLFTRNGRTFLPVHSRFACAFGKRFTAAGFLKKPRTVERFAQNPERWNVFGAKVPEPESSAPMTMKRFGFWEKRFIVADKCCVAGKSVAALVSYQKRATVVGMHMWCATDAQQVNEWPNWCHIGKRSTVMGIHSFPKHVCAAPRPKPATWKRFLWKAKRSSVMGTVVLGFGVATPKTFYRCGFRTQRFTVAWFLWKTHIVRTFVH